ncbi:GatB/YqeY domain-containing protein [Tomitella fengzijianii]|uniref:GatB/YqeY domain-containing protein n=1 Tax=Tomitella fengzijianii TaxID=2597660 RepID=A0A516X057_9ACTN|nr:GatB/YqeY domain-containing protein [Tomitella fengzijianii]QDQ96438.1 GatB/YqeY domain-containing protein [Tomitella fengzijianii]
MGELKDQIRADLTASMKAKDALRTGTLRMVLSAVQAEEVAGKEARTLTDDEVLKVIAKESKKRLEAAQVFDDADRAELAQKERAEEEILAAYLPQQLDDDELAQVADAAIAEVREQLGEQPGMRQMGQVMKAATARAAGRADGSRLSGAVRSRLAG